MYGCESWTINKAEHWRIDAFELWYWRRLLRVPWTARRSNLFILKKNQSWIFIGRTDVEVETPILWPPDVKKWFVWKDPDAGKDWKGEGDDRGWDGWTASPIQWTWVWVSSRSWGWKGKPGVLKSMGSKRVGHDWASELNWLIVQAEPGWAPSVKWAGPKWEALSNSPDALSRLGVGLI